MSFINWGEESPEQKQIRRRFEEEQMMFEQAIMMANAANASAAAAAAGSSKLGESLPAYCGGDKTLVNYVYWNFDLLKDKRFVPSFEELDTYPGDPNENDGAYRNFFNDWYNAQEIELFAKWGRNQTVAVAYPPIPEPSMFRRMIPHTSPNGASTKKVAAYDSWVDSGAAAQLPGVTELVILPAVELISDVPSSGEDGQIIYCLEDQAFRSWDSSGGQFSKGFFDSYISNTYDDILKNSERAIDNKRDMSLALAPFLWSAKYIPEFRIKKDNL